MRHFTLPPHWRPWWCLNIVRSFILSPLQDGHSDFFPRQSCTSALGGVPRLFFYSWAKPWYFHAACTSRPARTQDCDEIWRFYPQESNPIIRGRNCSIINYTWYSRRGVFGITTIPSTDSRIQFPWIKSPDFINVCARSCSAILKSRVGCIV